MLKAICFLFKTELLLFYRRSEQWLYPLGFFAIVISLFPFAFTADPILLQKLIPGGIWISALLASLLAIENIFLNDLEDGSIDQLLLSNVPLALIIFIKLCAQWIITELPLIFLTPIIGLLFHLSSNEIFILFLSLLFGTPILTLLGSLGVALTMGLREQGVLLGLIVLPLVIPVLIFGVTVVHQTRVGLSSIGPLTFLAGLSLLAISVLPLVIATTLRISLDD